MIAAEIILRARTDGVLLKATAAGVLKAAGNDEAVQRWLPTLKQHKPAIVAELTHWSVGLDYRIRRMARRWRYTPAELDDVLLLAEADPEKWERAVALDERREVEFRARGLLTDA